MPAHAVDAWRLLVIMCFDMFLYSLDVYKSNFLLSTNLGWVGAKFCFVVGIGLTFAIRVRFPVTAFDCTLFHIMVSQRRSIHGWRKSNVIGANQKVFDLRPIDIGANQRY